MIPAKPELVRELRAEVRAAQAAVSALDHTIAERLGINPTDHRCLDLIDQNGAMTAGTLADALRLSRSAITTVIDRLEALRYVRRVPGREDRRQVLVELTPLLLHRARRLYGDGSDVAEFLQRYTEEELVLLRDFVRWDRELNEQRIARLTRSQPIRRRNARRRTVRQR